MTVRLLLRSGPVKIERDVFKFDALRYTFYSMYIQEMTEDMKLQTKQAS